MASSSSAVAGTPGQLQTSICPTWVDLGSQGTASGDADIRYTTSDLRRAHTVTHGTNTRDKPTANAKTTRERIATSFLRVKDSHELLRKRSFKRANAPQTAGEPLSTTREPNHFTVGNVGQNGAIFLRPIRNPSTTEPFQAPSAPTLNKTRQEHLQPHAHTGRDRAQPSRWSNSQLSELRPDLIPEEGPEDDSSVDTESAHSQHHHLHPRPRKAHSFSTVSEQWSEVRRPEELQIFIEQAAGRPKTADEPLRRPSDSAITPYHLGWPLPTLDNETALLSSVYVRTSLSTDLRASDIPRDYWINTAAPNAYIRDPVRPSFAGSFFSGTGAIEMPLGPAINEQSTYELKEPIEPSIFEVLASQMDKESVVRYVAGTKDISAATPARIVAQISSASFMDYELVSDFFLTFRSYLAPSTLLALLLARLRWAINRPQDDGRIIRIRTFAALRHWILNYFVDDFVPDYSLRASFCETINGMYIDVKARQGGGLSDLKILIDLKRCWYGKCSLYWDTAEQHVAFHSPEVAIRPGGGEDDMTVDATGDKVLAVGGPDFNLGVGLERSVSHTASHHQRNNSATTSGSLPITTTSDRSIHATSCSLPPKSPKRLSLVVNPNKAPHPVPLAPLKLVSSRDAVPPSPLTTRRLPYSSHKHKRSGSFSDSVRDDRAPFSFLSSGQHPASTYAVLNLGSLIRGELYPPAESYTIMMAPPSPPLPSSARDVSPNRRNTLNTTSKPSSSGSGVKTIIGSIRRALNSRHGGPSGSRGMQGQTTPSYQGRISALPNNVAFGSDLYRDKKATTATKRRFRIDTLCDEALRQYRSAVTEQAKSKPVVLPPGTFQHSTAAENETETHLATAGLTRLDSQLTAGSESIVIVDGTGIAVPMMPGAFGADASLEEPPRFLEAEPFSQTLNAPSLQVHSQRSTLATGEYSLPVYLDESESGTLSRASKFLRPSGSSSSRRSYSVERGSAFCKRTSPSLRLRKYASFQSGISKLRLTLGSEPTVAVSAQYSRQELDRPAGPTLRRRPGGDLRQMRNESCPQSRVHSQSMLSDVTHRTSGADSFDTRLENPGSRPQTSLIPPNPRYSLITTHSSQNMRRSFEAAIAQFAQIPDDGDGGVESALLKLEGKWQGQPASDQETASNEAEHWSQGHSLNSFCEEDQCYRHQAAHHQPGPATTVRRHETFLGDSLTYSQIQGRLLHHRSYSHSVTETENSNNLIPLLERGLSDDSMKKPASDPLPSHVTGSSQIQANENSNRSTTDVDSEHSSLDIVRKTESLNRIPRGSTLPVVLPGSRKQAGRLSGLSSEISLDPIDAQAVEQQVSLDTHRLSDVSLGIPPHPLAHPPSPPMTIPNTRSISCATPLNPILFPTQPLTPDPSPRNVAGQADGRAMDVEHVSGDVLSRSEKNRKTPQPLNDPKPDHVPFVLSCESHILAQQLTLVEMAALSEVDWRDLIEMRWSSGSPSALSWVQFLREGESRGIDLVVGRFNLMVKWVLSEIVLTLDLHERARTIAKFIHTAVHARRMCNYATMLQIAIALSSTDCSRLQSTWALVPPADRHMLKDMESLIQPIRNFHDLRVEMETANAQDGCIPFVGLYVHDLTYNAQKPARVTTHEGEPLINFERYRTTAKIVKSLLRLIDASTKYKFHPIPGIIERCLWIASLSEEQVQLRSKQLV
ncbi:mitotic regulator LTE1 [Aspergillus saccharolyticus JOP 1030-1]|uniref:Guanine nucleotide exchange factor n=1 Tax=Aspergillus saccharolyticus JOP 1030-1 TaxID=1450539 RepID=A0A318ZEI9_9EURO|nr:guanine nucleotide exchange factor [Aspergillus saccharolyticus JOP 1030-1]PYH45525.1 guanine nucleotide exchange factor [Aspergillus saccharolyticus JOP 1030-1]